MVEIVATLYKHGFRDAPKSLGIVKIVNNGTGTKELGNYDITLDVDGKITEVEVAEFARLEGDIWELLYDALGAIMFERSLVSGQE